MCELVGDIEEHFVVGAFHHFVGEDLTGVVDGFAVKVSANQSLGRNDGAIRVLLSLALAALSESFPSESTAKTDGT